MNEEKVFELYSEVRGGRNEGVVEVMQISHGRFPNAPSPVLMVHHT